jgi:hypothetical protein
MAKFEKGNPGGPGRPKGSRNVANVILDQLATEGAEKMVKKMIEIAAEGDRVAARLVLSRIWAAPKARAVPIELPEIDKPEDLVAAHAMVVSALSAGTLTTDEAAAISAVLETHRRAFELVAQESKIEKLEAKVRRLKADLQ